MSFRINMSKYYTSLLADAAPPAPVIPWYNAGGSPDPLTAYQPKGADDLANSYINIVNPGTYNAALGVAPTWDAVNGWIFNGVNQYLNTGLSPQGIWTVLIQFTNYSTADGLSFGSFIPPTSLFAFRTTALQFFYCNNDLVPGTAPYPSGNIAIAGPAGYLNGLPDVILAGTVVLAIPAFIGCVDFFGGPNFYVSIRIQALAMYNSTLTPAQVLAVATAMALL